MMKKYIDCIVVITDRKVLGNVLKFWSGTSGFSLHIALTVRQKLCSLQGIPILSLGAKPAKPTLKSNFANQTAIWW
jgi:hypothetical protein